MKIGIALGAVVVALVLVASLIPLKTVPYAVMVDYEDIETYYEEEPYEDVETYTETELVPQVEILEHHMDIEGGVLWVRGQVKNSSNVTFAIVDVSIHAICPIRGVEDSYSAKSVVLDYPAAFTPGEVRDFSATFSRNLVEDSYTLKLYEPVEEIIVRKERTVTKYRQVERQRTVTKQRQETRYKKVTLLDYLLHYQ